MTYAGNAVALGNGAKVNGTSSSTSGGAMAIGNGATVAAGAQNAIAHGTGASVASTRSIAVGYASSVDANSASAIAQGNGAAITYAQNALALGNGAQIKGASGNVSDGAMAIGNGATVASNAQNAIAQGNGANVGNANAVAIGHGATGGSTTAPTVGTSDTSGIAIGGGAWANWGVAIGDQAKTSTSGYGVSIGRQTSTGLRGTALGFSTSATGVGSVGIGDKSQAQSDQSVAIGAQASVDGNSASSMAQGNGATVTYAQNSVALGSGTKINGANNATSGASTVVGSSSTIGSSASYSVVVGNSNTVANGAQGSVVLGSTTSSSAQNGLAFGQNTSVGSGADSGVAIGTSTLVGSNAKRGVALGYVAGAQSADSIAIGSQASVDGNSASSTAQGNGAAVTYAQNALALGTGAKVKGASGSVSDGSMAIGNGAAVSAGATDAIAQGSGAQAQSAQSVAIGRNATAKGGKAVSIGMGNTANGDGSVAIGDPNNAGTASVAMGRDNNANASNGQTGGVAIGDTNTAAGLGAVALGSKNDAEGQGSIALGNQSTTTSAGGIALGDAAASKAQNALAFGANAVANNAGDVALGAGSTTGSASSPASGTIDGTTYQYAGKNPSSVVSVGAQGKERQITNVAAGNVNANSTDAINGSQLFATNQAVNGVGKRVDQLGNSAATVLGGNAAYDTTTGKLSMSNVGGTGQNNVNDAIASVATTAGKGWNVQANGDTATQVKPGDTVQFKDGQNIKVTRNGTDITVATADDLTATSITTGNSKLDTNGLTIANGPSVLASGIDAGGKKITSVAAGDVSSSSTDAINGSQLNTTNQNLSTVASNTSKYLGGGADVQNGTAPSYSVGGSTYNNAGDAFAAVDSGKSGVVQRTSTADVTTMVASGGTAANPGNAQKLTNLAAGDVTSSSKDAVNGSQLYAVQQTANAGWNVQANGDTATQVKPGDTVQFKDGQNIKVTRNGTDVTVATADDLTASSITTGNSKLDTNGLTIANGPSVLASGIDAGGKKLTSVAAGDVSATSTDAINGSQLNTTNQNLSTVASNTSKYLGGGADVQNGTAPSYSVGGATYNNAGDAFAAVDSGKSGVVQRTSTTDVTTMVANGGTAANPGNAQKLTNLAAGTLSSSSTDAVNGSQLYAAGSSAATVLGGNAAYDTSTGQLSMSNVGGTGQNNVNDAIASVATTAGKGWNVQTNGDTATQVKPGDTVQFKDGQNIKVTRNGTDITVATADDLNAVSLTTGNARLDTNGLSVGSNVSLGSSGLVIVNGPSVTSSGIDAGGQRITNVAAGVAGTDAVNVSQLTQATSGAANRWVTGSQTTTYVAPSATGTESTAVGSGSSASGSNTVAVGTGAAASTANSVALGNGSTTTAAVATTGTTLRGQTYAFAGSAPVGVVSVGSAGSERQIQNVAAGQLSASSTDAVNGSQLYATNQAIESVRATADAGFNVTTAATGSGVAVGSSVARVSPGSTVTYTAGNNMTLTQNGTDITYALSDNLTLNSLTVGNTTVANNGVSIAGGPSMTTTGIDAGGQRVTNVAPGVAGTDAVNVDQLNQGITSANRYTDRAVATVRKDANAGTAAALATANLPQAFMPGRGMTSVALGSYQGQSAVAVGVSALSDNARWVFKLSGSATTRGNVGVGAGVGFQW